MNFKAFTLAGLATLTTLPLQAAVLFVTSLADSGPGSLRDEVSLSAPGDTIEFSVAGTILLTSVSGPITIGKALSIIGPGPARLIISAGKVIRPFYITGTPVVLAGMTIRDGLAPAPDGQDGGLGEDGGNGGDAYGGAIFNSGDLTLSNCWITANTARGGRGGKGGFNGVIPVPPGNGGYGGLAVAGGVFDDVGGDLHAINCTFSDDWAIGGAGGGGGDNYQSAYNGGKGGGGGMASNGVAFVKFSPSPGFTNCTFSTNSATGGVGGTGGEGGPSIGGDGGRGGPAIVGVMLVEVGSAFVSCTVVSNTCFGGAGGSGGTGAVPGPNGASGIGAIGAIWTLAPSVCGVSGASFGNTIVADNSCDFGNSFGPEMLDLGYNFIGDDNGGSLRSCLLSSTQMGTVGLPLHPKLGPLAQNGGGIPTHDTQLSSPVTDQGFAFGLTGDARGAPRPFDFGSIPNATGGDGSDIGAYELGTTDLGMHQGGNHVVASWPAYYGDFALQSTFDLNRPTSWTNVTETPVVIGDQLVVSNNIVGLRMFYRLINH